MTSLQTDQRYSPADLLALPNAERYELVGGELVERAMGVLASLVEGIVFGKLYSFCQARDLALVWPGTNGIQCFPDDADKVRRPDVSLLRRDRMTADLLAESYLSIAPDLAVEVLSPNDLAYEIDAKVEEYLSAGVALVWVIDPVARIVLIHRKDGSTAKLRLHDQLSGEDVVPGFTCPVSELFPVLDK